MSTGPQNQSRRSPLKTHEAATGQGSVLRRYQDLILGHRSWGGLLYFEFCMLFANCQGALGLFLRRLFWPRLLGSCGAGVMFGAGVILRHPRRIHLGDRVVVSEGCILDARNPDSGRVLVIGDDVNLANNVMLSSKMGGIHIGARTGVGARTIVHSAAGNPVGIGADVVVGPQCYIVGGGNYYLDRIDLPIWRQGIKPDGGVSIADDVWLGAKVSVLGGVSMASGAVAATGAVVTKDVPARAMVMGAPAKVVKMREEEQGT